MQFATAVVGIHEKCGSTSWRRRYKIQNRCKMRAGFSAVKADCSVSPAVIYRPPSIHWLANCSASDQRAGRSRAKSSNWDSDCPSSANAMLVWRSLVK